MSPSPKISVKTFKSNASTFPRGHARAIEALLELDHPMVPNVIAYDDKSMAYEWVEGQTLGELELNSVEDMMWVLSSCMDLMRQLTTKTYKGMFLFADDMHFLNLVVTPDKQLKIIDLDQFGFYYKPDVYRYLNRNYFYIVDGFRCSNYI